jgi:hypothetical protein
MSEDDELVDLRALGLSVKAVRRAVNRRANEMAHSGSWFGKWALLTITRLAVEYAASRGGMQKSANEVVEFVSAIEPDGLLRLHVYEAQGRSFTATVELVAMVQMRASRSSGGGLGGVTSPSPLEAVA